MPTLPEMRLEHLPSAILSVFALAGILAGCCLTKPARQLPAIAPGADWFDANGNLIEAHDGGVLQEGATFYLYGVDRSKMTRHDGDGSFYRVNMYSSRDLIRWKYEDPILLETDHPDLANPERVVERPKIIYNEASRHYVMYFHYDRRARYGLWEIGVATSPTIDGHYRYLKRFKPLGADTGDLTLFKDDDGTGYLFHTSHGRLRVVRLTPDYLDAEEELIHTDYVGEAQSVIKLNGRYYCFMSGLTGWTHNDNFYCTAPHPAGPWSEPVLFVPPGSRTYRSQNTFTLEVKGSTTTTYIYLGDRWDRGGDSSRYVWLPFEVNQGRFWLEWLDQWTIDIRTGEWKALQ